MKALLRTSVVFIAVLGMSTESFAQEPQVLSAEASVDAPPTQEELVELRNALVKAFESRNIDEMLTHVHPEIVVTWQNADVTRGHDEVRAYFNKMLSGPQSVVVAAKGNPEIESRKAFGNHIVSFGHMNDELTLRGESEPLRFDSRFSSLIVRHEGKVKLAGLHLSLNAFDNPVNKFAMDALKRYGVLGGLGILVVGFLLGFLMRGGRS